MSTFARTLATLGVVALLVPPAVVAVGEGTAAEVVPCADCHDTVAAAFAANPHARAFGRDVDPNAVCASCHSGGAQHAEASGDKALIGKPKGADGARLCLGCHGGKSPNDIEPKGVHATRGVHCEACHSMHPSKVMAESLLVSPGSSLCVSCHPDVAGSFRKPYTHPMHKSVDGSGKAGMQCASCHNPHGRGGEQGLVRSAAGEVACLGCHTDKRGPFVFSHPALETRGCLGCHEPHGSANPMMLTRSRVAPLCLECHSPTSAATVGSQPPSFHDLRSPRYQNCTTCHTAVHGSNSSPLLLK
ncbi:MAG TPA: cytochrome c3 family protein [Thermoanaerobaculaceae bacterium]|nr:cytochrome c3 family protein [Thermoanaerobaculaceae bacterium]HRS17012.1 cytochrome c3 family protein [Thermoanaerobaculaceae bacterium]